MNIPKLKVMPCPIWAGRHPYHEHRFIATADAVAEIDNPDADPSDQDFSMETGRIIATMTDCEGQAELATLFSAAPEMLTALQAIDGVWREWVRAQAGEHPGPSTVDAMHVIQESARAAITKATGGKPEATTTPAPAPNPLAAALRWALDSLPEDLDHDDRAKKIAANALLSGIPATPAPTPDRLPDALVALQECVDLLRNSNVRFKICDGGRGNLGEASSYHRAMNKANKVLRPKH